MTFRSDETERLFAQSGDGLVPPVRKPWSSPIVIVSELRNAGAHVAIGSDGTDSRDGYQYGS